MLLALILLVGATISPLSPVDAAALPVDFGAQDWEYSEFTKAFSRYLQSTNPVVSYLFIALGVGLIILIVLELLRRRRESRIDQDAQPSTDTPDNNPAQRRAWARIESSLDCRFIIRSHDSTTVSGDFLPNEEEIKGLIVDLSGGGCRITTSFELKVGDEIELYLELDPQRRLAVKGEVVRIETDADSNQTFAGIRFKDIREAVRDQIISWMFKHQQSILEGQRRLEEGLCLRCGKPLSEAMRQHTVFCYKCDRLQNSNRLRRY